MKPGTKLLSHCGNEWRVKRHDHDNPERMMVETHEGRQFWVHSSVVHLHAKPLRWYHRTAAQRIVLAIGVLAIFLGLAVQFKVLR